MMFALLGPVGFFAPVFLWVVPFIGLLAHWRDIGDEMRQSRFALLWKSGYLGFVPLFGLVSVAWSITPQDAAATAFKVFSFVTAGAVLIDVLKHNATDSLRETLFAWTAYGLIAAQLVVLSDLMLDGAIYKLLGHEKFADIVYSRGSVVTALTLLPIAIALARFKRWALFAAFVVLGVTTVFVISSHSAMLAVIVSVGVFSLVWWRKWLYWAILGIPALFLVAAPANSLIELSEEDLCRIKAIKSTAAHRLVIWEFASEKALQRPLAGWGMDSSRSVSGGKNKVTIANCYNPLSKQVESYVGENIPLHPHNAAYQLWLELGLIGVLIAGFAVVHLMHGAYRRATGRIDTALVAAVFSGCIVVYNVSFGIWQSWLIFACISLCALTSLAMRPRGSNET